LLLLFKRTKEKYLRFSENKKMVEKQKLNVDMPGAISDFEEAVKEFKLREKIYRIIYRGKGLEFEDYQDYTPDDDASNIDWKASLRANKLIVKRYKEERDLEIMFVIDVSENMILGSVDKLKCEFAAELIAALSHLIVTSNDKIGYILFSDKIVDFVPPNRGLNHLYRFIDKLADSETYGGISKIDIAYKFVLENLNKPIQAVIFISDFIRMGRNLRLYEDLYLIANKFETSAIMIKDPLDRNLPNVNKEIVIEDPHSGQQILINPKKVGKIYERYALEQENLVRDVFRKSNIDLLRLTTEKSFILPLSMFLTERVERKGVVI
jgi:uncharacterized protein (DUF58 family)